MLTIQFGQCGNQLGQELFAKVSKDIECQNSGVSYASNYDYSQSSCERWFSGITMNGERIARAILVDTETKVIDRICRRASTGGRWGYSPKNMIYQTTSGGSGNNWAHGYHVKFRELEGEIVEAVRVETEKADRLDGYFGVLGCAGGTGSGVGSRSMEIIRDEYPTKTLLANLILPFVTGEVATQNYNSILTLAKLSEVIDAMILMENDRLLEICKSVGAHKINDDRSIENMNEIACEQIVAVFQPVYEVRNELNYFANKIAPHPGYKIATIHCTTPLKFSKTAGELRTNVNAPETGSFAWQVHVRQLKHGLRIIGSLRNYKSTTDEAGNSKRVSNRGYPVESAHYVYRRSVANTLITRGYARNIKNKNATQRTDDDPINVELIANDSLYPSWVPRGHRFTHMHQKRRLLEREKFATIVTNNSQICDSIDGLVNKAWNAYTHSAFLHPYKEFGLDDDDFLRAFAKLENIIKTYRELDQ